MKIKRGSTSVRRLIFIADSTSTTGAGLTGLVYNSAGLAAYYFAGDLADEVVITLATATLGTWTSGGFIQVDATNMPGWYEVGIPNAALDGGNEVAIQFRGATNMVPVNIYVELDTVDYQTDAFGSLKPTTAGRTLDVSAGGEAGVDWANVGSPTTTLALTGTTIKTATDVETDTADIQSRLPSALVSGRIDASVGAMTSGVITAAAIASDAITDAKVASDVTIASVTGAVGSVTGNVGGNVTGSVGSVVGLTASNLDVAVSTLATAANLATVAGYLDTEIAAIKTKTDQFVFTVANQVDANALTGGGGNATLANQEEIIALLEGVEVVHVSSPVIDEETIEMVQGDTYDGIAQAKLTWTVAKDYTDGWAGTFTIRDADDAVVTTATATIVNATTITVTVTAPTGLTMTGCPGVWQGKFDVQMSKSTYRDTIARGSVYVYEDQTRT